MSLLKIISRLLVFAGVTVLTVLLLRYWLASKQYVFNREDVAKLAKQYAGEFGFACEKKLPLHFILFIFKAKLILVAWTAISACPVHFKCVCSQDRTMSRLSPKWWWSWEKGNDTVTCRLACIRQLVVASVQFPSLLGFLSYLLAAKWCNLSLQHVPISLHSFLVWYGCLIHFHFLILYEKLV